ncbi:MAG: PadR family transcriptional regulator [Ruminococcaceae bacterium]|nr:PadR family transcriptional regulator [Oscillospiraceae bacterium]
MDIQIKRGLLEVCVLAALSRGDSYGYQIIKDIEPYIAISESTLYPILRRLEEGRCLMVYSVEHKGRLRKYYRITDTGLMRLEGFSAEWQEIMNVYRFITGEADENDKK